MLMLVLVFNKPPASPAMMVLKFCEAPTSFNRPTTATGSVA